MNKNNLRFHELLILSLRTFRTKPQRAFLTIAGMSVGIATVLLLVSLGYGFQYILIGKLMTTEDSLITMEISQPTESNILINNDILDKIRNSPDVEEVSPVAEFPGEIQMQGKEGGLLIYSRIIEPSYFRLSGLIPDIGLTPTSDNQGLVASSQMLVPINLEINESSINKLLNLKIFYEDSINGISEETTSINPIPLKGIITDDSISPTVIVFSESLIKQPPFYNKVLVKAESVEVLETLKDRLLGEGFLVSARIDLVNQARKITNIITIILGVFGVTALIVSAIGMFNTMLVGFLERIYEVGILKSLGATDYDVKNLFLVEASMMGLLGGAGGLLFGIGLGKLLNYILSIVAINFGGKPIDLFIFPVWFIFLILGFSVAIGFMSGWWPAHRAARLSPKEAFTKR